MGSVVFIRSKRKDARPDEGAFRLEWTDALGRARVQTCSDLRKETKKNRDIATRRLLKLEEKVVLQRMGLEPVEVNAGGYTLGDALEWFVDRKKHLASYATYAGIARKYFAESGLWSIPAEAVTLADAVQFLDRIGGVSQRYKAYIRDTAARALNELRRAGVYNGQNVWRDVEIRKARVLPRAFLPAEWVWPVIWNAPPGWSEIFLWATHMGMRRGELWRLELEHIDSLDALTIGETKTGKPRVVPLHPEVKRLVDMRRDLGLTGLLFPSAKTNRQRSSSNQAATRVRKACLDAGVPAHIADRMTFHGLRHTWATHCLLCGVDKTARRAMGWGSQTGDVADDVYTHVPLEFKRRELAKLAYPRE